MTSGIDGRRRTKEANAQGDRYADDDAGQATSQAYVPDKTRAELKSDDLMEAAGRIIRLQRYDTPMKDSGISPWVLPSVHLG